MYYPCCDSRIILSFCHRTHDGDAGRLQLVVLDDELLPDVEEDVPVPDDVPDKLFDEEPLVKDDDFDADDTLVMSLVIGSLFGEGRLIAGCLRPAGEGEHDRGGSDVARAANSRSTALILP
jgi:hypothetical protein